MSARLDDAGSGGTRHLQLSTGALSGTGVLTVTHMPPRRGDVGQRGADRHPDRAKQDQTERHSHSNSHRIPPSGLWRERPSQTYDNVGRSPMMDTRWPKRL